MCLAAIGHRVICDDRDTELIRSLQRGKLPFYERHLPELVQRGLQTRTLTFTSDLSTSACGIDIAFLCVGVPQSENGEYDFSAQDSVAQSVARSHQPPGLLVERSTVPVETGKQLLHLLSAYSRNPQTRYRVAANPQLLREGSAVDDFLHPDRILLGIEELESETLLRQLYAPILEKRFDCPVHPQSCPERKPVDLVLTSVRSAELIKHLSNVFLGVKISYANVLADLCEKLGADVVEVTHAVGLDRRIGGQFLDAGLGFGGSRLPSDLRAFCRLAERIGVDFGIAAAAERVNRERIDHFFEKVQRSLWVLKDKRIALLGLAHKSDTDDIRMSPAVELLRRLLEVGARVRGYDPQAMPRAKESYSGLTCCRDAYEAAEGADALLIAADWDEFRSLDWPRVHGSMLRPLILDGRNLLPPSRMMSLGFEYHSVGRSD